MLQLQLLTRFSMGISCRDKHLYGIRGLKWLARYADFMHSARQAFGVFGWSASAGAKLTADYNSFLNIVYFYVDLFWLLRCCGKRTANVNIVFLAVIFFHQTGYTLALIIACSCMQMCNDTVRKDHLNSNMSFWEVSPVMFFTHKPKARLTVTRVAVSYDTNTIRCVPPGIIAW